MILWHKNVEGAGIPALTMGIQEGAGDNLLGLRTQLNFLWEVSKVTKGGEQIEWSRIQLVPQGND